MPDTPTNKSDAALAKSAATQIAVSTGPGAIPKYNPQIAVVDASMTITATSTDPATPLNLYHHGAVGGQYLARYYGFQDSVDPATYLGYDGSYCSRTQLIISSNTINPGTSGFQIIGPLAPTGYNGMMAIGMDVQGSGLAIGDDGFAGNRALDILDTTGAVRWSLDIPTGKMWWGTASTLDPNLHPNYGVNATTLYASAASTLKTDGHLIAGADIHTGGQFFFDGAAGNLQLGNGANANIQLSTSSLLLVSSTSLYSACAAYHITTQNLGTTWFLIDGANTYSFLPMLVGMGAPGSAAARLETKAVDGASNSFAAYDSSGNATLKVAPTGVAIGGGTICKKILSATATLDFPSTAAQTSSELTITVTGAAVGDSVAIGIPASTNANTCFTGRVTAADTVTIRFNNYSSAAVDPASATYRATVTQF